MPIRKFLETSWLAATAPVRTKPHEVFSRPPGKVSEMYVATPEAKEVNQRTAKVALARTLDTQPKIELDNGQQWRQVDTDVTVGFEAGDEVTIKRNAFGSHWMSANSRALRVERVR